MGQLVVRLTALSQAVVEQQMVKRFTAYGDDIPLDFGEIAEADLTGLKSQWEHQF